MNIRTYSELITLPSFNERFRYLQLQGTVGEATFGYDRYLNQQFYRSREWKEIANKVYVRDNGCDLGAEGYDIYGEILVHHMNPIIADDIRYRTKYLLDLEFLISTSLKTHNAIHYSNEKILDPVIIERQPYDTCPWRRK